jgi:O-antigen ligase
LIIFVLRPSIHWAKPVILVFFLFVVFYSFDLKISFRDDRSISAEAVIETVKSIFNFTGFSQYDGPRQWRIEWWNKILDYTIFGENFWTGKGYGINLANDDGFQVFDFFQDQPLRSPHNSHLTFLARGGVPGFLAWLTLQGLFGMSLFRAYRKAVRSDRHDWATLNLWVLAYWFAFMVNATFDVFLEGPQGGIWFWCLFGFGIALMEAQRNGYTEPLVSCNHQSGATTEGNASSQPLPATWL